MPVLGTGRRGSSPHSRGGRLQVMPVQPEAGLIPAFAGSTVCCRQRSIRRGAHPRIRGEDWSNPGELVLTPGSSPHSRGGPGAWICGLVCPGLIPAFAGRTFTGGAYRPLRRAHPRIRGEDSFIVLPVVVVLGSSPHSRGGRDVDRFMATTFGLIPAFAGRTAGGMRISIRTGAHPRIRGEDLDYAAETEHEAGSSPHSRGGRTRAPRRTHRSGLIPAFAGRTRDPLPNAFHGGAHPRIRGEDPR